MLNWRRCNFLVINVYLHKIVIQASICLYVLVISVVGTLSFVTLYSATSLSREDDTYSSLISTNGTFPFGTGYVSSVYVRMHPHLTHSYAEYIYVPILLPLMWIHIMFPVCLWNALWPGKFRMPKCTCIYIAPWTYKYGLPWYGRVHMHKIEAGSMKGEEGCTMYDMMCCIDSGFDFCIYSATSS